MKKLLKGLLILMGGVIQDVERRGNTYEPQYSGRWVTKKRHGIEELEWKELRKEPKRTQHVSVFNIEDDYVMVVGNQPRPHAIETVECDDKKSVELALGILEAGYKTQGRVIISQEESYE